MSTRERYFALDILRGLSILLMMCHHFAVDLIGNGLIPAWLCDNLPFRIVQPIFASGFIAMSGASSRFGHNNIRRGLKICAAAAAISLVTWFLGDDMFIRFGILHFLGVMSLLYPLIRPWFEKCRIPGWVWFILWLISYQFFPVRTDIPWLWPLGFITRSFWSADYYPLLPWIFMYLFGAWAAVPIMEHKLPDWFYRIRCTWLEWVSRWSFWIYLLHQIPIYGLTLLLVKMKG
ncbi:MAG: heparan-alpha-glucosaminide N-acetyltransferase [Clostridiaceae bacterium]|nr:heparan-alpha-glucosaminide N-acetyltransferase [Clostridiaceae bacterium]